MYLKSGFAGWVHHHFDTIALVKYLNRMFGYSITVPEFIAEDSPWDDYWLDMHLTYADTFNDERLLRSARTAKNRQRFERDGHFCVLYELNSGDAEWRERETPDEMERRELLNWQK